jgi:UDP-N-acetylmuramoyl-tripeptide--D-alanyl-D-alanine ligase
LKALDAKTISIMTGGRLEAPEDIIVSHVSIDTRTLQKGSLFVALKGENADGHDYIEQAIRNGASLVLAKEGKQIPKGCPAVIVPDTLEALGTLAGEYRKLFRIPVVAKEMIAAILSARYNVHKTKGNYNNEIGLPLSVLELDEEHDVAVFEMGMRGFGQISQLSRIVRPDIAVITNIGISHIEILGSRQNILKAKLEILDGLSDDGIVILNGDDELLSGLNGLLRFRTLLYGIDENQDVWAYDLTSKGEEGVVFHVKTGKSDMELFIPAPGIHNVQNALAGLAVAECLNMSEKEIREGISCYTGEQLRMCISEKDGIKIINDTYNAAPSSMKAAIDVLCDISAHRRRWVVLGDMLELGEWAEEAHKKIGRLVSKLGIEYMVGIGSLAKWYVEGANEDPSGRTVTKLFTDAAEAKPYIKALVQKGDVLLIKGSRMMKLDVLAKELLSEGLN